MRVGVTGHRSYDDAGRVLRTIEDAVGVLRVRAAAPLQIWSSLAEGADRAVTEAVLADRAATLVAVLPLCADDYATDFDDKSSRDEFERLLARAQSVIVTGSDSSGARESAYERAGIAVLDAVDVLIAVWDGEPSRGRGGTAEIVAEARRRELDVIVVPVTREDARP